MATVSDAIHGSLLRAARALSLSSAAERVRTKRIQIAVTVYVPFRPVRHL